MLGHRRKYQDNLISTPAPSQVFFFFFFCFPVSTGFQKKKSGHYELIRVAECARVVAGVNNWNPDHSQLLGSLDSVKSAGWVGDRGGRSLESTYSRRKLKFPNLQPITSHTLPPPPSLQLRQNMFHWPTAIRSFVSLDLWQSLLTLSTGTAGYFSLVPGLHKSRYLLLFFYSGKVKGNGNSASRTSLTYLKHMSYGYYDWTRQSSYSSLFETYRTLVWCNCMNPCSPSERV